MRINAFNWDAAVIIALGLIRSGYQVLLQTDEFQTLQPPERMGVVIDFVKPDWEDDHFMLESECYPNDDETLKI